MYDPYDPYDMYDMYDPYDPYDPYDRYDRYDLYGPRKYSPLVTGKQVKCYITEVYITLL